MKALAWAAFVAVVASLAMVRLTHPSDPVASYSFLLTDWVSRPAMVNQCMIKLRRGPDPQDQAVWQAMGVKDPATRSYLGRLRYCYQAFRDWQDAFRPRPG
ncbi:hypothetical protein [Rhodopila globiformis]|uniref:TIGR02301 family protein n=1 Tax=Rhodopila globiformis TaxID=1071 RepID=A0A2S6N8U4_RHOGL|nr:hypothetical protein [Rhodopila globiformis]PPQ31042.1 hypothetical protein CCS01_18190 [Rhodopila globiformis]